MWIYTRIYQRSIKKDSSISDNSALGNTICENLILLFPTQLQPLDIKIKFHFFTLLRLTKDWHFQRKWWDPVDRIGMIWILFLMYKWRVKADFHSTVFHVQIRAPKFTVGISDENKDDWVQAELVFITKIILTIIVR